MTDLQKALRAEKIKIPKLLPEELLNPGFFELDCPKDYCKKARAQTDAQCLKLDIQPGYASWKCRHCLWTGHVGEKPEILPPAPTASEKTEEMPAKANAGLTETALKFLSALGITEEMAVKHKLGWDSEREAIKFPYFAGDEIINAMLMPLTGASRMASAKRIIFYGIDRLREEVKEIIIAQNEIDAIVLEGLGFSNVIGLPNGGNIPLQHDDEYEQEPDRFSYLAAAADILQKWQRVKFALYDTPESMEQRNELSRRIGPGKCWAVKFSRPTLMLTREQLGEDDICADMNEAKPLPIRGLYEVSDFEKELYAYFDKGLSAGVDTGWENVDKLYTVVPGQLTVVTGIPNSGKSEWVDALSVNLALNHGWRFAAFSPENGKELHTIKLVEKRVEMSADPKAKERMSFDTFFSGSQWVGKHYSFIESTEIMPTLDWILERAADAALRNGIKGLIIDPWNRIEKKLENHRSETDYVAAAIPRILRFLGNHGVHGWLIVHPKQQEPDRKSGEIRAPSLYDMAGSAHFVNMCDNGIVIHRSASIDDTTEVHVKKVRFKHVGKRGLTKLSYNLVTGRYSPLDTNPIYTFGNEGGDGIQVTEPI